MLYGEDVKEEEAEKICEAVKLKVGGDVDVTLINGGQPVYYFIISVE